MEEKVIKAKTLEPTATKTKTPAKNTQKTTINKSEEEPLERIKKREPGAIIDKDKERRDNERMLKKELILANASETLLKGKEKRKLAKYDRQDGKTVMSLNSRKTRATGSSSNFRYLY